MKNLAIALGVALGLLAQYPATASERVTLRKECTASRCVFYKGSTRVLSVEEEHGTSRVVIRGKDRMIVAKARENRDGTIEVERTHKRR